MEKLSEVRVGIPCFVAQTARETKLRELGFIKGRRVILSSLTAANAIVLISGTRLAVDRKLIEQINVEEKLVEEDQVSLSYLKPGETGIVREIEAEVATKRRLMDMGITRGVSVFVRKLAPLGDPMELHLRGYSLSLRKEDAGCIKVVRENKGI